MMCEKCMEKNREIRKLREENIAMQRRASVPELQCGALRSPERPEYLTIEQAAGVLQLSAAQLRKYASDGQITAIQLAEGGSRRVPYMSFAEFLGRHTIAAMEGLPVL